MLRALVECVGSSAGARARISTSTRTAREGNRRSIGHPFPPPRSPTRHAAGWPAMVNNAPWRFYRAMGFLSCYELLTQCVSLYDLCARHVKLVWLAVRARTPACGGGESRRKACSGAPSPEPAPHCGPGGAIPESLSGGRMALPMHRIRLIGWPDHRLFLGPASGNRVACTPAPSGDRRAR